MKLLIIFFTVFLLTSCHKKNSVKMAKPLSSFVKDSIQAPDIYSTLPSFIIDHNNPTLLPVPDVVFMGADQVFSEFKFIPLETTDESLVGRIDKLITDDGYIFILDEKNLRLLQFSSEGQFIRRIGKYGRGPNEYLDIRDISIDKKNKILTIVDKYGSKLLYYDYRGNCIRESPMYYSFSFIEFMGDMRVLHTALAYNDEYPALNLHQLVITDNKQKPLYSDFSISKSRRDNFTFIAKCPLSQFSDTIYYVDVLSDTIWQVTPKGCEAAYVVAFPNRVQLFNSTELEQMDNTLFDKKRKNTPYFYGDFLITGDFIYLQIIENSIITPMIYSRKSKKKYRYASLGIPTQTSRLGDYLIGKPCSFVLYDSIFVSILQPNVIKNRVSVMSSESYNSLCAKDKKLLENLSEEDNPVLMLVKLKDF